MRDSCRSCNSRRTSSRCQISDFWCSPVLASSSTLATCCRSLSCSVVSNTWTTSWDSSGWWRSCTANLSLCWSCLVRVSRLPETWQDPSDTARFGVPTRSACVGVVDVAFRILPVCGVHNQNLQMGGLLILTRRTLAGLLFQGFESVQARLLLLFTQRLELLDRSLSNFSFYAAIVVAAVFDLFQAGRNTSLEQRVHVR
jgi:hypothetical protein